MKQRLTARSFGVLCLLLVSFHAAAGSVAQVTAEVALNKDASQGSYLFVTLRLESGEKLPFIVDTGAPVTLFAKSLEKKLGKRLGTVRLWSPGIGVRKSGVFAAPEIYFGETQLVTGSNVLTSTTALQTFFARRRVAGILGMDCLRHYCIQLDFVEGKMRFLEPGQRDTNQLGKAFPFMLSDSKSAAGVPFIQHAGLCGGTGTNLLIDTGCHIDGFVEDGAIKGHGVARLFSWLSRNRRVRNCVWDGAEYSKLRVRMTGRQNTLGLRMLARHLVTLDFPNRMMYLKQTSVGPFAGERVNRKS